MNIDEKLGLNKFNIDEENAHIIINDIDSSLAKALCDICPANLYKLEEDVLKFDYAGCLECGTCKMVSCIYANQKNEITSTMASANNCGKLLKQWKVPNASFGVIYRYG
ncbi:MULTISPECIES: ferredoxin family protein [unclassified Campylobacter]|uniref:ferredoxin family protein n=1 Tax=unclassified Campylobacter TaxID=2593542 RepID=UPI001BDAE8D0|nr:MULTISPECIES: ferredoxin family protein [unclassified Campylobacter]MBT0880940.1 ferredoxin family protein [Campylobacter sp. 2018MI27]MBT0884012.1 ferredoxin family protein [Campylobacter sp. 2018MI10]